MHSGHAGPPTQTKCTSSRQRLEKSIARNHSPLRQTRAIHTGHTKSMRNGGRSPNVVRIGTRNAARRMPADTGSVTNAIQCKPAPTGSGTGPRPLDKPLETAIPAVQAGLEAPLPGRHTATTTTTTATGISDAGTAGAQTNNQKRPKQREMARPGWTIPTNHHAYGPEESPHLPA